MLLNKDKVLFKIEENFSYVSSDSNLNSKIIKKDGG